MPKADRRYLYKRNGSPTWWIKFRVPGTNEIFRRSLKTKDLREAQARRDKLLEQRKQLGRADQLCNATGPASRTVPLQRRRS